MDFSRLLIGGGGGGGASGRRRPPEGPGGGGRCGVSGAYYHLMKEGRDCTVQLEGGNQGNRT